MSTLQLISCRLMSLLLYPTINPSRLFSWLVNQQFRRSVAFFKIDIGPFHLFMIIENSKSMIFGYVWCASMNIFIGQSAGTKMSCDQTTTLECQRCKETIPTLVSFLFQFTTQSYYSLALCFTQAPLMTIISTESTSWWWHDVNTRGNHFGFVTFMRGVL